MPASLRCSSVIGVGAPVNGSPPLEAFGKAITSRIDSVPARVAVSRSTPNAMPPFGGGAGASKAEPAVRRGAIPERLEQEAELALRLLTGQPDDVEHPLLHLAAVDTDRPTTQLHAIAHGVVRAGERVLGLRVKLVRPFGGRRRERVMDGRPAPRIGRLEHRRVD